MRRPRFRRLPAWLAMAALALTGACAGSGPPSGEQLRLAFEHQFPEAEFRREHRIRLGRMALGLGRGLLRIAADEPEANQVLSHVRRVEVSTYEVLSLPPLEQLETLKTFDHQLAQAGWFPLLKETDGESCTWIYLRHDEDGSIRNLYLVDLDEVEMTVVDLSGRLDQMVADLVADDPDGFIAELTG